MPHHHFERFSQKKRLPFTGFFLKSDFENFQRLTDFEENSWIMASLEQGLYIGIVQLSSSVVWPKVLVRFEVLVRSLGPFKASVRSGGWTKVKLEKP